MSKKHVIGYVCTAILALTLGSVTAYNAKAPGPTPLAVAPAECRTALDFVGKLTTVIANEHGSMTAALAQASKDGDIVTMATSVGAAITTVDSATTPLIPQIAAASAICRAAIK